MTRHKPSVNITRKVPEPLASLLQPHCPVNVHDSIEPLLGQELLALVRGAAAIVSIADDKMTGPVFDAARPQLKIVANYAVGYDNVDVDAAIARHIRVTHTPGVENNAVAELTLAPVLTLLRGVVRGNISRPDWRDPREDHGHRRVGRRPYAAARRRSRRAAPGETV